MSRLVHRRKETGLNRGCRGTHHQLILWIFLLILFARMILSWVPVLVRDWEPRGPMLVVAEIIYSITDPPLRLLRKVLAGQNWQHDARFGLHRPRDPGQHLDAVNRSVFF